MTYHHIWSDSGSILSQSVVISQRASYCNALWANQIRAQTPSAHSAVPAHLPAKIDFYYSACALSISYPGVASHKQMGARLQIYYRSGAIKKCNISLISACRH